MPKKTKTKKAAEAIRRREHAKHPSPMAEDYAQADLPGGAPAQDPNKG